MAAHRAQCPRCAYDLSGVTESWAGQCPLDGVCSECGLAFAWRDVLSSKRRLPRWSFEHVTPDRLRAAFVGTLARALLPHRLWRELRMELPLVPWRLAAFAILSVVSLKVVGLLVLGPMFLATRSPFGPRATPTSYILRLLWPYGDFDNRARVYILDPWPLITMLTVLMLPVAFAFLPESLRRARVHPRHLWRIQAYTIAIMPLLIGMWSFLRSARSLPIYRWMPRPIASETAAGLLAVSWTALTLISCWALAARLYLRLPHALPVAIAMTAIAGLISTIAVVLTCSYTLFR